MVSPLHSHFVFLLSLAACAACATSQSHITKIANGRQITTRSVDPTAYEHASRAFLYEEEEHWQDASAELERAIVFDSDSPELNAELAEVRLHLGRTQDAASAVRSSLGIAPTAVGLLAQAHVYREQGNWSGMVAALRQAKERVDFQAGNDEAESVYLELADSELRVLDLAGARNTLETLCRLEPSSAAGHMRLTGLYWASGEMAKAEAQLQAALAEEPNQVEALVALAWIYAASDKRQEARHAFHEALDRAEGALDIATAFARFLGSIGSRQEAEQLAEDLSLPDTGLDAETLPLRIELERSARRLDRALALVKQGRLLDLPEDEKLRLSLTEAALCKEQDRKQDALAILLAVGAKSPIFLEARLRASEILRDSNKPAEAAHLMEEASRTAQGDRAVIEVETEVSLSLIEEKRGDSASAVQRLEKLLGRNAGEPHALLTLAAIEERRGRWQHALDLVEPLLGKNPISVEALNFWGFVAADHNHSLALASTRLEVANTLDLGSGGLIDSLGWVHFRAGDLTRASLFLEQAGRLEPTDPEIQSHLGELYAKRQEFDRAAKTLRRALGLTPDERLHRKLEDRLAQIEARKDAGK